MPMDRCPQRDPIGERRHTFVQMHGGGKWSGGCEAFWQIRLDDEIYSLRPASPWWPSGCMGRSSLFRPFIPMRLMMAWVREERTETVAAAAEYQ